MHAEEQNLPSLSVVVATYNRADYLRISLACLLAQDYKGEREIIVADDGSSDHTKEVIADARSRAGNLEIQHCWREDKGYRRAYILNEASRMAGGDILIFVDSDCIPEENMLSVYASQAAPDAFYLGGVYYLTQRLSQDMLKKNTSFNPQEFWEKARLRGNKKKATRKRNFKRYWESRLYNAFKVKKPKIWGGNCAINRDTFEYINGYDENYSLFSKSDSDIRNRLVKGSFLAVPLQTIARAYHLWHSGPKWRKRPDIYDRSKHPYFTSPDPDVVCKNGLRKL